MMGKRVVLPPERRPMPSQFDGRRGYKWAVRDYDKRKTRIVLPLVTYARPPLMTLREWLACGIGLLVGGGLGAGIMWFIGVRQ